ncbi:unnamed protein product [Rotaria magnacalcarata]|uniref:PDZ domain-containing protein n=3 Tax=Rotaria magnacalcarata TaxID=392030 RepID=A0A816F3K6_9BILA|nr:unnamed protein product [Rotaria magnacalcarata]CAF1657355.1 unnamed protein product [Rotaria magnacalcarata]CAF4015976.1 unnamed protein product [Rotaria magnacalcarata]CAF4016141.1 unnamed protein product [Rotaria magnacalcarata]
MKPTEHTVVLHKRSDQQSFGLYIGEDYPVGVYIITIEPDSPAAQGNVHAGDRIISVNGQMVSKMATNPKETVSNIAKNAHSLTLSIQPSNIYDLIDKPSTIDFNNNKITTNANTNTNTNTNINTNTNTNTNYDYRYGAPMQSHDLDQNLENYIKSLFSAENIQIVRAPSGNPYEFVLISDRNSFQPTFRNTNRHNETKENTQALIDQKPKENIQTLIDQKPKENIQTLIDQKPKENTQTPPQQQVTPSTGISNLILRNSLAANANESNNSETSNSLPIIPSIIKNPEPRPAETAKVNRVSFHETQSEPEFSEQQQPESVYSQQQQSGPVFPQQQQSGPVTLNRQAEPTDPSEQAPLTNTPWLREIHLKRAPNLNVFGFDVKYNQMYYLVTAIEPNSPAAKYGLQENDVIRKLNNQPVENMSHTTFLDIISMNKEVTLLVQILDDYLQRNPPTQRPISTVSTTTTNSNSNESKGDQRKSVLSRVLSKFKNREGSSV